MEASPRTTPLNPLKGTVSKGPREKFLENKKTKIYNDNRAVFTIEKPSGKIVLLLWIERIFTGAGVEKNRITNVREFPF